MHLRPQLLAELGFVGGAIANKQNLDVLEHLHPWVVAPDRAWSREGLTAALGLSIRVLRTHLRVRLQQPLFGWAMHPHEFVELVGLGTVIGVLHLVANPCGDHHSWFLGHRSTHLPSSACAIG